MKHLILVLFIMSVTAAKAEAGTSTVYYDVPRNITVDGLYEPTKPNPFPTECIPGRLEVIADEHRIQLNQRESINLISQITNDDGDCKEVINIKQLNGTNSTTFTEAVVETCPHKAPITTENRLWKIEPGHISLQSNHPGNFRANYACDWRLK